MDLFAVHIAKLAVMSYNIAYEKLLFRFLIKSSVFTAIHPIIERLFTFHNTIKPYRKGKGDFK
ncbi:hypothetical protein LBYZC6_39330 [Lacrimispora brassicae]